MATHAKLSCAPRALAASMVFVLSALLAPIPCQAILIDSFNAGELAIIDGGLGIADGLGIVGGERELVSGINIFGEYSSNKGGNGRLSIVNLAGGVPAAEFFTVTYDGNDDSHLQDFGGLNKADFTDGGLSNAIRVRLIETTIALTIGITVQQLVGNPTVPGNTWFLKHEVDVGPIAAPTDVFFPFDDFEKTCSFCGTADFAQIDWMEISFFPVDPDGTPFQASVDFIQTQTDDPGPRGVPAPPVLALLVAGLASLITVRRAAAPVR